jgi:hypothetical protein
MESVILKKVLLPILAVLALACGGATWADTVDDPLHGQCNGTGGNTCTDIGVTPLGNSTTFGFTISPGPQTGNLFIDILLPNNYAPISFSVGGVTETQLGTWSSGTLASFLNINASPDNPFMNYIGLTQSLDPSATSYVVYQASLGLTTILGNGGASTAAGAFTLPGGLSSDLGAFIVAFCQNPGAPSTDCTSGNDNYIATANSGALIVNGNTPLPTPEPSSLTVLAAGLLALAALAGRRSLTA